MQNTCSAYLPLIVSTSRPILTAGQPHHMAYYLHITRKRTTIPRVVVRWYSQCILNGSRLILTEAGVDPGIYNEDKRDWGVGSNQCTGAGNRKNDFWIDVSLTRIRTQVPCCTTPKRIVLVQWHSQINVRYKCPVLLVYSFIHDECCDRGNQHKRKNHPKSLPWPNGIETIIGRTKTLDQQHCARHQIQAILFAESPVHIILW
jgi:hypothetical protein